MRLASAPSLFSGLLVFASIHHVGALNLQFSRRAVSAHYNAPTPSLGAGFSNLLGGSDGPHVLAAGDGKDATPLGNVADVRYTTHITLNGKDFHVALDTGSTDLWVLAPDGLGTYNDTAIPLSLGYGDGSYGVKGTIGLAPFEFGDYKIDQQAFLLAETSTIGKMQDLGIDGLLGLSFNVDRVSPINAAVKGMYGDEATWGRSVLNNIFNQHPDQPNYLAIDLARTHDWEDTDGGSFGIGEVEEKYTSVLNAPKLPQHPKGGSRWTVLLDGIKVDGSPVELQSKIAGVPEGKMQSLLDTGDPTALMPPFLRDAIYSKIPGAVSWDTEDGDRVWIVPCNTTASVVLTFSGEDFPMHPLDLTSIRQAGKGDQAYTFCIASIVAAPEGWGGNEFEISLGDAFLRNVYSVYDFGDGTTGDPYVQLLAQTDPSRAAAQVPVIRAETMKDYPPELDPNDFLALLQSASDRASTGGPTKSAAKPQSTGDSEAANNVPSLVAASTGPYGPAIIALLSVNLIVTLVVAVFMVLNYMRRGRPSSTNYAGNSGPNYAPVRTTDGYKAY